jgi:putative transposase
MSLKRTKHAVYDIKYHFVWIPKYRKDILTGEIKNRIAQLFKEISGVYEFGIDTMEIMEDHVHIFLSAPPKYGPSKIVEIMKSQSAKVIFKEFSQLKKQLWGGEFWSDGYFVRTVGDKVTAEIIRRYIQYQHNEESTQLKLF